MNENGTADKHLLDQIEHALEDGRPTGNPLLDELASRQLQARPAFRQSLEERLVARMQVKREKEVPMVTATSYADVRAPRRSYMPFTLVAVLLAVLVTLGILGGSGRHSSPSLVALAQLTLTPTVTPVPDPTTNVVSQPQPNLRIPGIGNVRPVLMALKDIPAGTELNSRWLTTAYWQEDGNQNSLFASVEQVRGLVTIQDIARWQPILAENVSTQPVSFTISADKVVLTIPVGNISTIPDTIQRGDYVDVIGTYTYANEGTAPSQFQLLATPPVTKLNQTVTQSIANDVLVTRLQEINGESLISLAVTEQESEAINWLLAGRLPIELKKVEAVPNNDTSLRNAIEIPLHSVSQWAADTISVGDHVDVVVGHVLGNKLDVNLDFIATGTEYNWVDPDGSLFSANVYVPTTNNFEDGAFILRSALNKAEVIAVKAVTVNGTSLIIGISVDIESDTKRELMADYIKYGMPYIVIKSD